MAQGDLRRRVTNNRKSLSVIAVIVGIVVAIYPYVDSYFFIKNQIQNHEKAIETIKIEDIKSIKESVLQIDARVVASEKEIIRLQQQNAFTNETLTEIKSDLKEIKAILNKRR